MNWVDTSGSCTCTTSCDDVAYVPGRDGDQDGDGTPDYADFYSSAGGTDPGLFPVWISGTNLQVGAVIRINYDESDPLGVTWTGTGTTEDPYVFSPPTSGSLRLWTTNSSQRNADSVEDGGDLLPDGTELTVTELPSGSNGYKVSVGERDFYLNNPFYGEDVGSPPSTENASQSESMSGGNGQNEQAETATQGATAASAHNITVALEDTPAADTQAVTTGPEWALFETSDSRRWPDSQAVAKATLENKDLKVWVKASRNNASLEDLAEDITGHRNAWKGVSVEVRRDGHKVQGPIQQNDVVNVWPLLKTLERQLRESVVTEFSHFNANFESTTSRNEDWTDYHEADILTYFGTSGQPDANIRTDCYGAYKLIWCKAIIDTLTSSDNPTSVKFDDLKTPRKERLKPGNIPIYQENVQSTPAINSMKPGDRGWLPSYQHIDNPLTLGYGETHYTDKWISTHQAYIRQHPELDIQMGYWPGINIVRAKGQGRYWSFPGDVHDQQTFQRELRDHWSQGLFVGLDKHAHDNDAGAALPGQDLYLSQIDFIDYAALGRMTLELRESRR